MIEDIKFFKVFLVFPHPMGHSMATANLKKSKELVTNTTAASASIEIPLSNPNLISCSLEKKLFLKKKIVSLKKTTFEIL